MVNSPLHFSAKGRTTTTVYRKGGVFFDFLLYQMDFYWWFQIYKFSQVQGMKEANGRLGNSFHFGFASFITKTVFEKL